MKKKIIFTVIALLLIIGLIKGYLYFQAKKEPQYELTSVKKGKIDQTVSASGKIQTGKEVTLQFQTSGKLAWVGVKEGDKVNQWQAVAGLDVVELEKKLKKELNDYLNERWDFDQSREDYLITTDDLEKYTLTNAVRRILEKNQFDLNNTVLDVEIAHLAVDLATLVSPIEGIVTKMESPVAGVNTTPTISRIIISAPEEVYFEANIDENDVGQIKASQKAKLFLDAYPEEEFSSEVKEVSFVAVKTSGGGTAFPTKIYLDLPNNEEKFKIGMNGDVEIIIAQKENILHLPLEAIKKEKGKKYVRVLENGEIKDIEVKTGLETDTKVEIVEGVEEGEEVIIGKTKNKK